MVLCFCFEQQTTLDTLDSKQPVLCVQGLHAHRELLIDKCMLCTMKLLVTWSLAFDTA